MAVFFDPVEPELIKSLFYGFFQEAGIFFEMISDDVPIGFYGIRAITDKVCEISVYSKKIGGFKITKELVLKCLKFPFLLDFEKVFLRAERKKMKMLLCNFKKHGVHYLFEHKDMYFFEVLPHGK